MVFHDCVGGCDGCIDMINPENKGLDKPIDALLPIVQEFEPQGLSRTDVWMLSSLVATELALPFENSDLLFPMHWIGRQTCETRFGVEVAPDDSANCGVNFLGSPTTCSAKRGPHVTQPHGTIGTQSIQTFFREEFNFNAQQVTALMGAHSVGKMARENVGFHGEWDLSVSTMDGGYWLELVGNPPDFFIETIDNRDLPGNIPTQHQWRGIIPINEQQQQRTVAMLNVDVALVKNLPDMDANGNVGCAGPGFGLLKDCPPTSDNENGTPFLPFAKSYNADTRQFLMDFRDVLNLLIDHGHAKPTPNSKCPQGRVCTFGRHNSSTSSNSNNNNSNGDTNNHFEFAVEDHTPPPSPSPSREPPKSFPEPSEGQPKIWLDKFCYDNVGDNLVVTYDLFANGIATDITILLYSMDDVDITDYDGDTNITINPRFIDQPLNWSFSCGKSKCHTWTSRGGIQLSTQKLIGKGSDYAVVLFANRNGAVQQEQLKVLAGASFRLEGCLE